MPDWGNIASSESEIAAAPVYKMILPHNPRLNTQQGAYRHYSLWDNCSKRDLASLLPGS